MSDALPFLVAAIIIVLVALLGTFWRPFLLPILSPAYGRFTAWFSQFRTLIEQGQFQEAAALYLANKGQIPWTDVLQEKELRRHVECVLEGRTPSVPYAPIQWPSPVKPECQQLEELLLTLLEQAPEAFGRVDTHYEPVPAILAVVGDFLGQIYQLTGTWPSRLAAAWQTLERQQDHKSLQLFYNASLPEYFGLGATYKHLSTLPAHLRTSP